jgi:drug/metabolite transporter (DMT)-like permease
VSDGAPTHATGVPGTAKLLVLLLAFAWGLNWIAAAVALQEMPPWSLRLAGAAIGTATLFAAALLSGHHLRIPRGQRLHVMFAGFLNVAVFQIFAAFAQVSGTTSRVIIITYSMPIWTTVLGRLLLGEKLNRIGMLAFWLCVAGLTVLCWPLFADGFPLSVLFAFGSALSWAFATVYMKWVKATVEPLANAAWQLLFGFLITAIGTVLFEGMPQLWPLSTPSLVALLYVGVLGVGLAQFLWWTIIGRLPTATASISVLLVPVVGVIGSTIFLGERPTVPDIVGFMLIFVAAACVLLQPNVKHTGMPE